MAESAVIAQDALKCLAFSDEMEAEAICLLASPRGLGQRLASLGVITGLVSCCGTVCFCTDLFVLIITNKCLSSPSHHNLFFVKMISLVITVIQRVK